ncbi:MAG: PDGLE domain-containing protein [Actinomycetota bacterium]|nr:PDGLE domain-containing protein [Actinomycetota bacterium]
MRNVSRRLFVVMALALAVGLATAISPFASPSPDGLNKVAQDEGFAEAQAPSTLAPAPGYAFPGVENERVATGLAGFTGTLVLFALGFGLARLLRRGPPSGHPA